MSAAEKPVLVLVHGWAMHSGVFGRFAELLADDYRVHALQLPGHGGSPGQPLWSPASFAAERLGDFPAATWLGWSLGGQVALEAALQAPDQVERLVLLSVNPSFTARPGWPQAMATSVFDKFQRSCRRDAAATVEQFLGLQALRSAHAREVMGELRERHAAAPFPEQASLMRGLHWLAEADYRAALPRISTPALWLAGERDALAPAASSHAAAALMPQAQAQTLPGAGHAAFLSHPEALHSAISGWVKEGIKT
jgi:pimeloyl-[acyl-carrier protein] methyl ester esterase